MSSFSAGCLAGGKIQMVEAQDRLDGGMRTVGSMVKL